MQNLRVGTSGYSYPGPPPKGWFGVFYPDRRRRGFDALEYYCQFFGTVEINASFYRPPAASMARAWERKTPAGFEFAVKVWQKFTHARKIGEGVSGEGERWEGPQQGDVDLFIRGIEPLAESGKLGALLFQYPASFHCTRENMAALRWALRAFHDYPKVVELRHRSWSDRSGETRGMLNELKAGWVLADEPKFGSSVRQEWDPVGDILYLRAHGRNAARWWSHAEAWMRYDYCYSRDEIRELAGKLKAAARGRGDLKRVYVFFNNHARGQAVANAIMLSHEMGIPARGVPSQEFLKAFPQVAAMVAPPSQESLL